MPRILPTEVASVISKYYPWVQAQPHSRGVKLDHEQTAHLTAIVSLSDRIPAELISLPADKFAEYISNVEILRSYIQTFQQRGSSASFQATPLQRIYDALIACRDDLPAETIDSLSFVTHEQLRESIRVDIDNAERALVNSEWKAATVLGGAAVEALLLWKLSTLPLADVHAAASAVRPKWQNKVPELDVWHLPDYIEVSAAVPAGRAAITSDTAALLRVIKNYRNLVHPGAATRTAEKCDKRTAYAAIAGVAGVVTDLTR